MMLLLYASHPHHFLYNLSIYSLSFCFSLNDENILLNKAEKSDTMFHCASQSARNYENFEIFFNSCDKIRYHNLSMETQNI